MQNNTKNNKLIAKNTVFLYIRMLMTMAVSLYTSRVILAVLGAEDYGIYNVVGGVVTMFAFINGTLSGVTQRFLTFELGAKNTIRLNQVFNTAICIHFFVALVILVLSETIGLWFVYNKLVIPSSRMTAAVWVYQFSIFSTIIMIVSVPYNACIISHEHMSAFAYISIVEVLVKLAMVFVLKLLSFDKLILYAILMFVVQLLIRLIYNKYCKRHFEEANCKLRLDRTLAKEMMSFTGWSFFGGLASVGMGQGINILLNLFFGPVVNAARAFAVQIESAVSSFVQNFQTAINPQIVKNYANGNREQMHNLIYASCRYSYYLLLILSIPIYLDAPYVLDLWLKSTPLHTTSFLRITILISLINSISAPLMIAANATGEIKKYQIIVGSVLLAIVPIAYVALKFGASAEAVFWIYFVIASIAQGVRIYIVGGLVDFSILEYTHRVVIPIIIVTLFSVIGPWLYATTIMADCFSGLIVCCLLSFVSVVICVYALGITVNERQAVNKIFKNIFIQKMMLKRRL